MIDSNRIFLLRDIREKEKMYLCTINTRDIGIKNIKLHDN